MASLFNDKLFATTAFQQVIDALAPLNAFSTDLSSIAGKPGESITVPLFGAATATTFTQATDVMEQTGGAITAVTVTLNARKIVPVDITSQQLADSANAGNYDAFAYQMGAALTTMIFQDIFSLFTVASFGAPTTTASANFKLDAITAVRVALNAKKCPRIGRSLILDDSVESGLFSDTNLVLAQNRASGGTINEGDLGRILGFDIYTPTAFPLNSISLIGIGVGKGAAAVAFRSLSGIVPDQEYAAAEILTDAQTGISALYTRHWSRAQAKWFMNMQALYGYAKALTLQGHMITTATT